LITCPSDTKCSSTSSFNSAFKSPSVSSWVFSFDSPYSDNIKYSDDKKCIGKISCEKTEFYDELEKVAFEITRILKQGKVMGWVIADQWIKKKFTAVGFLLWQRLVKYFEPNEKTKLIIKSFGLGY